MLRFYFENASSLSDGIELLADDLGIKTVPEYLADIKVNVTELNLRTLSVSLDGNIASISYGEGKARFFRGLAILVNWVKNGDSRNNITETPLFKSNGAMVDMSRNAVMNVRTVKTMLRKMALMGLNTYMLYTEDTYEIEDYPYFGYMRGRYTKDEIKELDTYAIKLGIELVPCVQMLGHLATHLRWTAANKYKDTANTLLVGSDETYKLIDSMLKTVSECFTSRRLHIGMDETKDLGTGAYLNKNGYRERRDIYFEHLEKTAEMARSYGFSPMMWSDMFFRLAGKNIDGYYDYHPDVEFTDDVIENIPKGITQVFWDYYRPSEEFYSVNIDKHHKLFGKNTIFAGGIWTWSGHCPLFSRSLAFTHPALNACKKKGVEEIFATIWHNGAESSLIMGLLGLTWYADYDYKGKFDLDSVKECFKFSCGGISYDEIMNCELLERSEHPDGQLLSLTRAFLYNDPLLGLSDKHIEGYETSEHFKRVEAKLVSSNGDKGIFAAAYDNIVKLASLLQNKADFGVRLKSAYERKDSEALKEMLFECDLIIEKTSALRISHRASWMEYNKPFGWEALDIRYGGIIARFDTVKERLGAYLSGGIDRIEELEEERLRLDGELGENIEPRFHSQFLWMSYTYLSTPSKL